MGFMSNILSKTGLGALAIGIALALTPIKASALTLNSSDAGGGPFSLLASSYNFQQLFANNTPGATLSFEFVNDSASTMNVVLSSATISQNLNNFFVEGARVFWDTAGMVTDAAARQSSSNNKNFLLGAGMSDTLNVQFGNVIIQGNGPNPDIDFTVSAVPVPIPAAGLMLLTALGGLGLARRRRKVA